MEVNSGVGVLRLSAWGWEGQHRRPSGDGMGLIKGFGEEYILNLSVEM